MRLLPGGSFFASFAGGTFLLAGVLRAAVPGLPIETPMSFVAMALGVSLATGLASGVLPARRAADLDPIEALRTE